MKDSEFIALLNLYLDHEINAADAARLEAEVQANPSRRKVYQQYCRMQKGCKLLATDFATAESGVAAAADKKIVPFDPVSISAAEQKRQRVRGFYVFGGLAAAAACVAFVFVNRGAPTGERAQEVVVQSAPLAAVAATPAASADLPPPLVSRGGIVSVAGNRTQPQRSQPTLVAEQLFLSNSTPNALLTASAVDASNQLAWITNLQLAPLPQRTMADELRFDAAPATLRPDPRTLGGVRAQPGAEIEMAAFRFVK